MKILAINGSPRGKNSNTDKFLLPFLSGAKSAGAEIEEIYLCEKNIRGCQGCFSCWVKTPGKCMLKDDMPELLDKVNEVDVLIFATPLYYYSMTSHMKAFVDRMLPLLEPFFIDRNGMIGHPRRRKEPWKLLLFSNEGFIEKDNFDLLVANFNKIARALTDEGKLDATILRTLGEAVTNTPLLLTEAQKILDALEKAGMEYVSDGYIHPKTHEEIENPLSFITQEMLMTEVNKHWHELIESNKH